MITLSLPKKGTVTDWVDLKDGQKLKVDYPEGKQIHHLQDLLIESFDEEGEVLTSNFMSYCRYFIKYTVKDWQGIEPECVITRNELQDTLWYTLTNKPSVVQLLYSKIQDVLKWNDTEKKN